MKEALNKAKIKTSPIRKALDIVFEDKSDLLEDLKNVPAKSEEYYKINEKIANLQQREKELNEELLNNESDKRDPLLKKAINQLQSENENLKQKFNLFEKNQSPDYHKFSNKIQKLEEENKNLVEALKINQIKPQTAQIRRALETIQDEKEEILGNLKEKGANMKDYNKKILELQEREKDLNEDLLKAQNYNDDPLLKKAIDQLQKENQNLIESLALAEDRQTPEYHKFKDKVKNLESENEYLKESLKLQKSRAKSTPLKKALETIQEEKDELLDGLKNTPVESSEYYKLNQKIGNLKKQESKLNDELLESEQYKDDILLSKAISQLKKEKENLEAHLKRAEDRQTPDYHKFREKILNLELENENLKNSLKSNQRKPETLRVRRSLDNVQNQKAELLEDLKKTSGDSEEYKKLNNKIRQLQQKERVLNDELIKATEFKEDPQLKRAIAQLRQENLSLMENLKIAEDLQSPEYHKMKNKIYSVDMENKNLKDALKASATHPETSGIRNELENIQAQKAENLEELKKISPKSHEYENLNDKLHYLNSKEKELNEKLLDTQRFKGDLHLKNAIKQLQNDKEELEEQLSRAEEKQSPEYHSNKLKIENLQKENKNLKEALIAGQLQKDTIPIRKSIEEIQDEKADLLKNLKTKPVDSEAYKMLNKKIDYLQQR